MAITDKDIAKLRQAFATKDEISALDGKIIVLDNKFNAMIKEIFTIKDDHDRLEEKVNTMNHDMLNGMDRIMAELERARIDREFAVGKDREQDRRLDALEARVGR